MTFPLRTSLRTRSAQKLHVADSAASVIAADSMPIQHDSHSFSHGTLTGTIQDYLLPIVRESGRTHISEGPVDAPPNETYLSPGTVISERHIVEEWLGNYATAQIYRVRHATITTFRYILKTPRPSFAEHTEVIAQFHTEASALARLRDPLTPQVIDLGALEDGRPFVCLEIIPGLALEELTRIYGPQPEPVVWHIGADILALIAEMHDLGMTHGNLQPSTVRLWKDPSHNAVHPRLLDFSTTQTHAPEEAGTFSPTWGAQYRSLFTSQYIAPDCLADRHFPTCDVYSVGLILAELLDGAPLFTNDQHSMRSNAGADIHAHGVVLGMLSQQSAIAPVLQRALHPNPHRRYANAGEMLRAMLDIAEAREPGIVGEFSENISGRFHGANANNTASIASSSTAGRGAIARSQQHKAHDPGTARMYKVPTNDARFSHVNADEVSHHGQETGPANAFSLVARILLIVLFMAAAFSILFLGLPG